MKIKDIENLFEKNVSKKALTIITLDKDNQKSLINSTKLVFDFDEIVDANDITEGTKEKIKTSDTVYFKNNKITFVEFKSGGIGERDFKLKATESIISLYNFAFKNGINDTLCFPTDIFEFYMVYDKKNPSSATRLAFFIATERKLQIKYKHLFSKYHIIDNVKFQRLFRI